MPKKKKIVEDTALHTIGYKIMKKYIVNRLTLPGLYQMTVSGFVINYEKTADSKMKISKHSMYAVRSYAMKDILEYESKNKIFKCAYES